MLLCIHEFIFNYFYQTPLPSCFFFFNDTATTEIYTLSLHDALPISQAHCRRTEAMPAPPRAPQTSPDRKSTRLNSSHVSSSYAVFCLKKKREGDCRNRGRDCSDRVWQIQRRV